MRLTPEACRAARAILKWSMRDLASKSGVSWTAINRLEAGGRSHASTVEKIAAAFSAEGIELIGDDERSGAALIYARRREKGDNE